MLAKKEESDRVRRGVKFVVLLAALMIAAGGSPSFADWDVGDDYKMHYPQLPDPVGWDVYAEYPRGIADDWECTESGFVSDIHFWGSWNYDIVGDTGDVYVGIYENDTTSWGFPTPGNELWSHVFAEDDYTSLKWSESGQQGWYNPRTGYYDENNHEDIYQYNIPIIPDPFYQEEGNIYWLMISVDYYDCQWGWKTSESELFGADAVFYNWVDYQWCPIELYDPMAPTVSLDMAFVITPEPSTICLLALGGLALRRKRRS